MSASLPLMLSTMIGVEECSRICWQTSRPSHLGITRSSKMRSGSSRSNASNASTFPGISVDGGMANFLKTSARAVVKLNPSLHPKDIAALADAGLTAYHAVKKASPLLYPGTKTVVIGAGGLGHIGIQCLKALTPTEIIVVDRSPAALELTRSWGANHTVLADGNH